MNMTLSMANAFIDQVIFQSWTHAFDDTNNHDTGTYHSRRVGQNVVR